jgi:RsmE family RNA methyltransferase
VLRVAAGDRLRVGRLDGPLGDARVGGVSPSGVELHCTFAGGAPPRSDDTLLLAVPRPKVLRRCLEDATALGFGRIVLLRSWRVDKSHLNSAAMQPSAQRAHLLVGLAQARRTRLPEIDTAPLFKPFVEDRLDALVPATNRFVADPDAALDLAGATVGAAPLTLAIGPERGFLPYEVEALIARGFAAVHAGRHPLRVETALAHLHGGLALLRQRAALQ